MNPIPRPSARSKASALRHHLSADNPYICPPTTNNETAFANTKRSIAFNTNNKLPAMKNPELDLALDFVEKTNRNIFLTGKAGTGKTTFLHNIRQSSMKRLIVVAPTGVAAINAKGVTIHSFFQMPFGPIIPGTDISQSAQRKFNRSKIDILRSLDLLIIDEISMVRADLLDGIDQVLRRYKNRNLVFGGVQVLMIGDLQQLAPVVKPQEWELLQDHYANAFFFSAKSFQEADAVGIELRHIYRQDDEKFIAILNEIRNDQLTPESAAVINARYQPDFVPPPDSGYITLTTHNSRAHTINQQELDKLDTKTHAFDAVIEGKFNASAYPNHEILKLKEGSQVMFIKNDSSMDKRYYNGKIGKVVHLDGESITVRCPGDDEDILVEPETWENTTFSIDKNTKEIKSKLVGSFTQIPLRLAWAITIHKSQGLTFEKAIIDAEASFAHGQTYVALSRCKSLEGIVLKSKISDSSIISDSQVNSFIHQVEKNQPDDTVLTTSKKTYQLNLIHELFNYYAFTYPLRRLVDISQKNSSSIEGNLLEIFLPIKEKVIPELLKIGQGFKSQIETMSADVASISEDKTIQERLKKAIAYFLNTTEDQIQKPVEDLHMSTENKQVKKDLSTQLERFHELLSQQLFCLRGLQKGFTIERYLDLRAKAVLQKKQKKSSTKSRVAVTTTDHPELYELLRSLRTDFSEEEDVKAFQVFPQRTLYELCNYFPATTKQLKAIHGMGKVRVEKYGEDILSVIQNYIKEKKMTEEIIKKQSELSPVKKVAKEKKTPTKEISLALFQKGMSFAEIAKHRELKQGTIENHLMPYVTTGEMKITDFMPQEKHAELKEIMTRTPYETFTDLKHKIDDKFTYNEMRLVAMDLDKTKE